MKTKNYLNMTTRNLTDNMVQSIAAATVVPVLLMAIGTVSLAAALPAALLELLKRVLDKVLDKLGT